MKFSKFAYLFALFALVSCLKEKIGHPYPPVTWVATVKLKALEIQNLPSPYYYFEYNDTGNITRADFSGGLWTYKVTYDGRNISSMQNMTNPNHISNLEYQYQNGQLLAVTVKDENGVPLRHCIFSYGSPHQLQEIDWDVRDGNVGFDFEQSVKFSYYADGNLMEMTTHNYAVGSQTEATFTDRFENYDNNLNVDDFSLTHTTPHDLILVPGLKLQINNPGRNIRTGDGLNYEVDYNYVYDSRMRPVQKSGDIKITNGAMAGQHVQSLTTFSYYD